MDKKKRWIEWGKNLLIAALAVNAVWLSVRSGLVGRLDSLLKEEDYVPTSGQTQTEGRTEFARPLRGTVRLPGENAGKCYGVLYDQESCDSLFQAVAGLLVEALSAPDQPEAMSRDQWEQMLTAAGGLCFDFQGEMPLDVLSGWLSGEETALTVCVRRLGLAVWNEEAYLFCQDGQGSGFRCRADMVDTHRLEEALTGLADNGAFYAFEAEQYGMLAEDTLLSEDAPAPQVYTASNPVAAGQDDLEALAGDLGFAINTNGIYYAGQWVARSGNDTLRLSDDGVVNYLADEEGGEHFPLSVERDIPDRFDAVEACHPSPLRGGTDLPPVGDRYPGRLGGRLWIQPGRHTRPTGGGQRGPLCGAGQPGDPIHPAAAQLRRNGRPADCPARAPGCRRPGGHGPVRGGTDGGLLRRRRGSGPGRLGCLLSGKGVREWNEPS